MINIKIIPFIISVLIQELSEIYLRYTCKSVFFLFVVAIIDLVSFVVANLSLLKLVSYLFELFIQILAHGTLVLFKLLTFHDIFIMLVISAFVVLGYTKMLERIYLYFFFRGFIEPDQIKKIVKERILDLDSNGFMDLLGTVKWIIVFVLAIIFWFKS